MVKRLLVLIVLLTALVPPGILTGRTVNARVLEPTVPAIDQQAEADQAPVADDEPLDEEVETAPDVAPAV